MSAEILRRAAADMREDFTPWPQHPEDGCCDAINFHNAVARWLESVADDQNVDFDLINSEGYCALDVARAYLGGQP